MAVDATMRKLQMPPRFMPYLERHRIYDLFFELGNVIGKNQPKDHILFLRNILIHMNETRNKARLFLIAPPFMEKRKIAEMISSRTGQTVINRSDILNDIKTKDVNVLANTTRSFIVENDLDKNGWILYDYPNSDEEAKALLLTGTVPTHTFLFIPLSKTKTAKELWKDNLDQWSLSDIKEAWNNYQRLVKKFRFTFRSTFREVNILCKTMEEILMKCSKLLKEFPTRGPPSTLRVVLIGTRGSRRGELATLLAQNLNLVPIDMHQLIEETKLKENDMAEQIKFLDERKVPIYGSIIVKMLQERLLEEDCLTNGWVLIRFPRDRADLQAIDSFDTPPNRIIFLTTNCSDAFAKLKDIRIHKYTGTLDTKTDLDMRAIYSEENNYFIHPTDDEKRILMEHENYSAAYQDMVNYCEEDCAIVDASGPIEAVFERIQSVVGRGTCPGYPRAGSKNYRKPCTEDEWGLGPDLNNENASGVSSNPYLFSSVVKSKNNQRKSTLCKEIPIPENQITVVSKPVLPISRSTEYFDIAFKDIKEGSISNRPLTSLISESKLISYTESETEKSAHNNKISVSTTSSVRNSEKRINNSASIQQSHQGSFESSKPKPDTTDENLAQEY